jgi:hypothetical protein
MKNTKDCLLVGAILTFFIYLGISHWWDTRSIKQDKRFTSGTVIKIKPSKGGDIVVFEYIVSEKKFTNQDGFAGFCSDLSGQLQNHTFPVIYESGDPQNSRLLITEKSFSRFDLSLPDSLKWVLDYCN